MSVSTLEMEQTGRPDTDKISSGTCFIHLTVIHVAIVTKSATFVSCDGVKTKKKSGRDNSASVFLRKSSFKSRYTKDVVADRKVFTVHVFTMTPFPCK